MPIPAIAWALAAPAIAKGVSSLGNYFNPVKYKKSGFEKNYISELQRRTREGVLTGGMQREIVSQTSRAASQFADIGKSQVQGTVTNQGLENSAVMTQSTMGIDAERIRRVAEAARKISLKNQMSKVAAQDTLGGYGMSESRRMYGMALQRRGDLTSAINSAGSAAGTIAGELNTGWGKDKSGNWVRDKTIRKSQDAYENMENWVIFDEAKTYISQNPNTEIKVNTDGQLFYYDSDGNAVIIGNVRNY